MQVTEKIPEGGFVIARKIFKSDIWIKDPLYLKIWIWIVGKANHCDAEKKGKCYKRGEFVTTYNDIIKFTSYYHNRKHIFPSIKQVRIILKWLESEGMIRVEPLKSEPCLTGADSTARTRAYLGIKIAVIKYDTYQDLKNYKGRDKGRPSVQQGHNNNNVKNELNNNNIFSPNSDEFRLARLLYELILENDPKAKEPILQNWAYDIDKLHRIDKRDFEEIEAVIRWCQKDDFWHTNILSSEKLRSKFRQLNLKMKGNGDARNSNGKAKGFGNSRGTGAPSTKYTKVSETVLTT